MAVAAATPGGTGACHHAIVNCLEPGQAFEELPEELTRVFGEPEFVLELDLSQDRKLANADIGQVIENLSQQGYHLQLPPETPVEEIIQRSLK